MTLLSAGHTTVCFGRVRRFPLGRRRPLNWAVSALSVGFGFALLTGCVAGPSASPETFRGRKISLPSGVDASRALLTLEQIEPAIPRPVRPASLGPLSERSEKQIVKAATLVRERRFTEAAIELERALRYNPNHPDIHYVLAMLHWEAGNIERARTHAAKTLEGNPDCAAAHYVNARCSGIASDTAHAMTSFRTALMCSDFGGDSAMAALCHYRLAEILAADGYYAASLSQYEAFEKTAQTASGDARVSAAQDELRTLLTSGRGSAAEDKSVVLEQLGMYGEAALAFEEVVGAAPDDATRALRYARLLLRADRLDEALEVTRAIESESNEPIIALLFDIHDRMGHPERVIPDLRSRFAEQPDSPRLLLNFVDALLKVERLPDARWELESFLERHEDATSVRVRLFEVLTVQEAWVDLLGFVARSTSQKRDRFGDLDTIIERIASDESAVATVLAADVLVTDDPILNYLLGAIAASAGQTQQAKTLLVRSLDGDASLTPARVALGQLYFGEYRYDDARKVVESRPESATNSAALERVLAAASHRLGDTAGAVRHYRAAVQLDRNDVESMFRLAILHYQKKDVRSAQRQLRVLLEHDPDHEAARESLAQTYLNDGKLDVAKEEYEELRRRSSKATTKARCTILLDEKLRNDPVAARQLLMAAMEEGEPDAATWVAIAQTYDRTEHKASRKAYRKAIVLEPEKEEAVLGAIDSDRALLSFESAIVRLNGYLRRWPNDQAWRLVLVSLHSIVNDFDAALAELRPQVRRDDLPDAELTAYRTALVDVLNHAGRFDDAIDKLNIWADEEVDGSDWFRRLGRAYLQRKKPVLAARTFEEVLRANPRKHSARRNLVFALRRAERFDEASQHVLDWLSDDPEHDNTVWMLANVLFDSDRFDDAVELVHNRLLRTNSREGFQDVLLSRLRQAKRYGENIELAQGLLDAVSAIRRMAPQLPGRAWQDGLTDEELMMQPNLPFSMGRLHRRAEALRLRLLLDLVADKQYRTAERRVGEWLDGPSSPQSRATYLLLLAAAQRAQGHEEQAAENMERALVLRPGDVSLSNDLSYTWIDRGIRLDDAEPLIRYAVGRFPLQAAYLDTYGWLLYKKGAFAEAAVWLGRANRARAGEDPVILDHLGDTFWRLSKREQAIAHWNRAVDVVSEKSDEELANDDERRVRSQAPAKIEKARSNHEPPVAPLKAPTRKRKQQGKSKLMEEA